MTRQARRLERADHRRSRLMALLAVGTLTLGFAGFGVVMTAGPALADPACQEIAVGSDTTQDVMNQYSVDLTGNLLCSYNATDPVTGATNLNISYIRGVNATQPSISCAYTRPNGTGPGQVALRESINPGESAATPVLSPTPVALGSDCVDIARSSNAPSSNTQGLLTYIPFAEDAVTGVVGPATGGTVQGLLGPVTAVATNITEANLFTQVDLTDLYDNCEEVTVGSGSSAVTYWPYELNTTQPSGTQRIDLYVPQLGSGTEKFWAQETGNWNSADLAPCVFDTIQQGTSVNTSIEQNNGLAVATDPDGYVPFSIAQWISQSVHTTGDPVDLDVRYGAQLQDIVNTSGTAVAPYTGTVPNETLNTSFPFNREVYNIVEGCRVDSTAPVPTFSGTSCSIDSNLVAMLVGTSSSLCQDELTIENYGFALLGPFPANPNEPDNCGSIAPALRAVPQTSF